MKRLPQPAIDRIVDFSAEAAVSLPPYALEKGYHVVDAMRIIACSVSGQPSKYGSRP